MANLSLKTNLVNIVVRKKDFKISTRHNLIMEWCNINCELFVFIYHKYDKNPVTGEIEDEHLHLVCTLKQRKLLSTTLNSFTSFVGLTTLGVMIDKVVSYEGSIQYLLHKNDKQKDKHDFEELYYNYDESELRTIIDCECSSLTPERLYTIVKESKSNYDIIVALGLGRYSVYRKIILDIKEDLRIQRAKEHDWLLTHGNETFQET